MVEAVIVFVVIGLVIVSIVISPLFTQWRRDRLKRRPFPPLWAAIIENCLPIYLRLSVDERKRLQGHIQVFLAEKQFIGCAGLQITEEMRVAIASVACLLLLNERGRYFSKLRSVLVYPTTYFVEETAIAGNYVVEERRVARLGESWSHDQVVLSWEQVQQDAQNWRDGRNVVLHEFAHQLDQEDGSAEGVPYLPRRSDYQKWTEVMSVEYQQLCREVDKGSRSVLDSYGATNPAEFFAVATETFFEKPKLLQKHHPALYLQLKFYYQVDPVQWV